MNWPKLSFRRRSTARSRTIRGELSINGFKVETPMLWLGQRLGDNPKPWVMAKCDVPGLMVNASHILLKHRSVEFIDGIGLREYLQYNGPIFMDSGGYQLQSCHNYSFEPKDVLSIYSKLAPDIGAILDHPLRPASRSIVNHGRWKRTLENTSEMLASKGGVPLIPVVHGYTLKDLELSCRQIETRFGVPPLIALGSLVPLIKGMFVRDRFWQSLPEHARLSAEGLGNYPNLFYIVEAIKLVRDHFPKSALHVFGVGSTTTLHIMLYLGVDSIDSSGWRLKAAHGAIQLPGFGDTFLRRRKHTIRSRRKISRNEIHLLSRCKCPICGPEDGDINSIVRVLRNSFNAKATHNAWVSLQEAERFKRAQDENRITQFVRKRLRNSHRYSVMLEYALRSAGTLA